ncbi:uncharacterized protein CXQ87_000888 [Candidozyma duobushaemuli]|uniref:JAB1/MPN/MOV34 metalloenzyme domain-containing protein n=2 Tax=Candidozyma TaxID=3303203 RepID=A0ABX8I262_9ASCO|nr:uncharacterized protein CXQ87_000888 [[Candida] duobushaemulonis]PVH17979.1 hypothetical protein CXQ87_000888 [[Candida] duobushaemulonis]QWU86558.1 hypothetical protein CA3LBN_000776 [[Candida] haemuloni]
MLVQLKATALYAISDQTSRNTSVGVLVGEERESSIVVADAFELKWSAHKIDYDNLNKRLRLLSVVSPQASLVGLFSTDQEAPQAAIDDFKKYGDRLPPIYVSLRGKDLKCYSSSNHTAVPLTIIAESTEAIATNTIHSHANYTKDEPELTQVSEEAAVYSLEQLERRVQRLLETENLSDSAEKDLVYLANKLSSAPQNDDGDLELVSSRLAILTNSLSTSRAANAHFAPRATR